MSTRKIFAAAASVAIVASTIAMFNSSSKVKLSAIGSPAALSTDTRPVTMLAPVTVYASPLPQVTVAPLEADFGAPRSGLALHAGSRLSMPYYSFASNLKSIIKE